MDRCLASHRSPCCRSVASALHREGFTLPGLRDAYHSGPGGAALVSDYLGQVADLDLRLGERLQLVIAIGAHDGKGDRDAESAEW